MNIWHFFPTQQDKDKGSRCTVGWTSCSELKKEIKGGRPKWVTDRRPVKRLRFHTFWKWRSHTYCKQREGNQPDTPQGIISSGKCKKTFPELLEYYNCMHSTLNGLNAQQSPLFGNNNKLEKTSDSTRIIYVCAHTIFYIYIHMSICKLLIKV